MIIGIVVLSIIAVIAIMALIGYFIEKNENKKHKESKVTNINTLESIEIETIRNKPFIMEEEVKTEPEIETTEIKENDNAATNANIPEVLDFNTISKELEDK